MKRVTSAILCIFLLTGVVAIDHVTKQAARNTFRGAHPYSCAGGLVIFTYEENAGGLLSIGESMAASTRFLILTVGVGVVLLVLVGFLLFARNLAPAMGFAFALIAGGGLGNLYDRLTNTGRVVDFLMVGMGSLRTGIFNVADLAITFGVGLFVLAAIQRKRETGS